GLEGMTVPLRVAVMGCVVNGPGEAREADLGVASGNGKGQIFVKGEGIKTVPEDQIVETLIAEANRIAEEMGIDDGDAASSTGTSPVVTVSWESPVPLWRRSAATIRTLAGRDRDAALAVCVRDPVGSVVAAVQAERLGERGPAGIAMLGVLGA